MHTRRAFFSCSLSGGGWRRWADSFSLAAAASVSMSESGSSSWLSGAAVSGGTVLAAVALNASDSLFAALAAPSASSSQRLREDWAASEESVGRGEDTGATVGAAAEKGARAPARRDVGGCV